MLVWSFALATMLATVRIFAKRGRPANAQFLYDMLGVWTVIELLLIVGADLDPSVTGLPLPDMVELIRSNGALMPFALLYCAWAVFQSTIEPTWTVLRSPAKKEDDA